MKAEFVKTNKGSNRTWVDEAKWESAWVRWIYVRAWERGRRREGWRESVENGKYHGRKKQQILTIKLFCRRRDVSTTNVEPLRSGKLFCVAITNKKLGAARTIKLVLRVRVCLTVCECLGIGVCVCVCVWMCVRVRVSGKKDRES